MKLATKDRLSYETIIISSCLKNQGYFMQIFNWGADKELFKAENNRLLFAYIMRAYYEEGKIPTVSGLYEYMVLSQAPKDLCDYLKNDIMPAASSPKVLEYVKLLAEDNMDFELREAISKVGGSGIDYGIGLSEAVSNILNKHRQKYSRELSNAEIGAEVLKDISDAKKGIRSDFINTGFDSIDNHTGGIPKRYLTVVAARPGHGKTDMALQLMRNFLSQGLKVGLFSLEMDARDIMKRNISEAAEINSRRLDSGEITVEEFEKVKASIERLSNNNYIVADSGHMTPQKIKSKINLWRVNHKIDVCILDYLTLVKSHYGKDRNDLEIGELTSDLRMFAKESGIPLIILSQLNREVEKRNDRRPQLSDLRESGQIEQDAALVLLLHWPDKNKIDPFQKTSNSYLTKDSFSLKKEEYFEVLIAKARAGRTGRAVLRYRPEFHRFESIRVLPKLQDEYVNASISEDEGII